MKSSIRNILTAVSLSLLFAVGALGQAVSFNDENVGYTFDLPNTTWKMTAKPSAMSPNVEYVYGERNQGYLEIRRLSVAKDALIADVIADEEQKLKFLQGYVAGKTENFAGNLRGNAFNYEFVRAGRNMSGRFYFLKADQTTIYVLRFTAFSDSLKAIRNQTDFIARSFEIKKLKP